MGVLTEQGIVKKSGISRMKSGEAKLMEVVLTEQTTTKEYGISRMKTIEANLVMLGLERLGPNVWITPGNRS
jgi:1,2-phenylacetyl-CoA epoxidase PaaB subunit